MLVEVSQRILRRMSHASCALSELPPDKRQPNVTHHSYPRPQPRGGTSGMILKKFLYILLYQSGKFFNRKRGHTLGNVRELRFGLEHCKQFLLIAKRKRCGDASHSKALCAKDPGASILFRERFWSAHPSSRRFKTARVNCLRGDQLRPQIMATDVVRLPPMLNVRNLFTFSIWRAPACPVSCS